MKVIGQALVPQPDIRKYDRSRGWMTVKTWKGTKAEIEAQMKRLELDFEVESFEPRRNGAVWELSAVYNSSNSSGGSGSDAILSETWEGDFEKVTRMLAAADFLSALGAARAAWIEQANLAIDQGKGVALRDDNGTPDALKSYIELRLTGTDSYVVFVPVLTRTLRLPSDSTIRASHSMTGKAIPTSSLPVPRNAIMAVPSGWEWLVNGPQVVQVPKGYNLVQKYDGARSWSKALYGGSSIP